MWDCIVIVPNIVLSLFVMIDLEKRIERRETGIVVADLSHCDLDYIPSSFQFPELNVLRLESNNITNLSNIHKKVKHCVVITLNNNPLMSHILGLMLIKGLREVWYYPLSGPIRYVEEGIEAIEIVLKHLRSDERDIHLCQEELIDRGLSRYAKL